MTVSDSIIYALISTLGGVISYMWRKLSADHDLLVKRADECEAHRMQMQERIANLVGDGELLARCPAKACPFRDDPKKETTRVQLHPRTAA